MHYKRKRARIHQRRGHNNRRHIEERLPGQWMRFIWLNQWPESWDIMHHRRPMRRLEKSFERQARFDRADADLVAGAQEAAPLFLVRARGR
jgi:hypothetical protein